MYRTCCIGCGCHGCGTGSTGNAEVCYLYYAVCSHQNVLGFDAVSYTHLDVYKRQGYQSVLTLYETQNAIGLIHQTFEEHLSQTLNLKRVSAPLFVDPSTGLNDNLNGVERPVSFEVPATGVTAEVVHSLAKWKRMALYRYDFRPGKGLYTNMNACLLYTSRCV